MTDFDKYLKILEKIKARSIVHAQRTAVNALAFEGRRVAVANVERRMILKNRWTAASIRVDKARVSDRPIASRLGSTEAYMRRQEFGDTRPGVPLATSVAAGQGRQTRPRTRLPTRRHRMPSIQLKTPSRGSQGRRTRNAIAIKTARSQKHKFVWLDLGRREGIFRVYSRRIEMIWATNRRVAVTPANPWLEPASEAVIPLGPRAYADALRWQLRHIRL